MIEIELTQDQITWIDDIDSDLAKSSWCAHYHPSIRGFYAVRGIRIGLKVKTTLMHRVILSRMLSRELLRSEQCDHINGNTLDNRRSNLRLATKFENMHNSRKHKNNTSEYKGVSWHKPSNKWKAQITVNRKSIYLGLFDTPEEAHQVYCDAADYYHGEFKNYG